jgi:hypothetical protein
MGGIAGFLENIIFFWLESYEYYPQILVVPYYDMTLGAFLSQRFYVSAVAVCIAGFHLGVGPILLFTAMFVGIECLYLAVGVYKLNWWHPAYTGVGLLIYFWIAKKWYKLMLQPTSRYFRWFTLFCFSYTLYSDFVAIPAFANHYYFALDWFDDTAKTAVYAIILQMLVKSMILAIICSDSKPRWLIMGSMPLVIWVGYFVCTRLQIVSFKYVWDLIIVAVSDIVVLLCCYNYNRVLMRVKKF